MIAVQAKFQEASVILANLSEWVASAHATIPRVEQPDAIAENIQKEALAYAGHVNALENMCAFKIFIAAAAITQVSRAGWEKNHRVVSLWHQLAEIVTRFSTHPDTTKSVATLIIDGSIHLQAFSANRVPNGIVRHGEHYMKGQRKKFILCSERNALARLLAIQPRKLSQKSGKNQDAAWQVAQMTVDIIDKAKATPEVLRDSFLVTTKPLCMECAHAIAPFRPRGILTLESGSHFTRWPEMKKASEYLEAMSIPIAQLRSPAFV